MKNILKSFFGGLAAAAVSVSIATAQEPADTLDQLIDRLESENRQQSAEQRERLQRFQGQAAQQQRLLSEAEAELEALERRAEELEAQFRANDALVAELDEELRAKQGDFGELFGVARQAAGEAQSIIDGSLASAEFPGRTDALQAISETESLPEREELDAIWKGYLREMIAQRDVHTFQAPVSNYGNDGQTEVTTVTRVGPFIAFANNRGNPRFLTYKADDEGNYSLNVLPREPVGSVVAGAKALISADPGEITRGLYDPSRGGLLELIVEVPSLGERINQGGIVGYIIIGLLIFGVIFGLFRLFQLFMVNSAVRAQARKSTPSRGNPLGRVMIAAEEARSSDVNTFELRLDNAILKESAGIDFGLNFIKLLAAVAPLLGLLGTVTGMIQTFQQITLFGAGDPQIMAGGISQALVTTVLGLVAAIPLLLIHSFCSSAARGVQQLMDERASGLVAEHALDSRGRG